ncbi:MAG TPA: hypothetical protein VK963_00575 [Candidatus Saccharimonadales bacterium]|nr:hypothetical protein [Candidatus Saccharimonadales bacterium]
MRATVVVEAACSPEVERFAQWFVGVFHPGPVLYFVLAGPKIL